MERIPGFLPDGRRSDSPGLNQEFPVIFEYAGSLAGALQDFHDNAAAYGNRDASVIVRNLAGLEVLRWNILQMRLTQIQPGDEGRTRYTLTVQAVPDTIVSVQSGSSTLPAQSSRNPGTDTRVEVAGFTLGPYPVAEVNATTRTITLTYDYIEGGQVWEWPFLTATGAAGKTTLSIIQETGGVETGRTRYFEVFPILFQHFTGFGQPEKVKLRLVIAYGFAQVGG